MKNAIVTGGTKGIGLATARMLLKEGYHVTVTYSGDSEAALRCRNELKDISSHSEIIKCDQSNKEDMRRLVELMKNKGNVDCIVCNAGVSLRRQFTEITDEEWERAMHINVNSNVFLIRDLYEVIAPSSRIVFIGSMMGVQPHATSLSYGVTKAALHALAQNLVKCFEGSGTTVNAIAPGFVETDWHLTKPQQIRENIYAKTALGRFATPDEVADAVKFCINNQFVNGSILEISGGYSFK